MIAVERPHGETDHHIADGWESHDGTLWLYIDHDGELSDVATYPNGQWLAIYHKELEK